MKKYIFIVSTASMMLANIAFGQATSTPSTMSNGDPMAVVQVWGLTGYQTPIIPCKNGIGMCMDISKTPYYIRIMRAVGLLK